MALLGDGGDTPIVTALYQVVYVMYFIYDLPISSF